MIKYSSNHGRRFLDFAILVEGGGGSRGWNAATSPRVLILSLAIFVLTVLSAVDNRGKRRGEGALSRIREPFPREKSEKEKEREKKEKKEKLDELDFYKYL